MSEGISVPRACESFSSRKRRVGLRAILLGLTVAAVLFGSISIYLREKRFVETEKLIRHRRDVQIAALKRQRALHPERAGECNDLIKDTEKDYQIIVRNLRRGLRP